MRRIAKRLVYLIPVRHRRRLARKITEDMRSYCADCHESAYADYTVHNSLWRYYGAGSSLLHVRCLERRMQRKLRLRDFPHKPINEMLFQGARMAP